jgi:trk system potassium uptake protein TrkA
VNPDLSITTEIFKYLVEKYSLINGIFSRGNAALLEFPVNKTPEFIGVEIGDFNDRMPGTLAVAMSREGKVIIPHVNTMIQKDDELYVVGEKSLIMSLNSKVRKNGKYTDIRRVMIIGGGNIGLYLASMLSDFGVSVKLIEQDKKRCHYLSAQLDKVIILHGNATDINLLEDEGIRETGAFITVTGHDEENLLLALTAKNYGVEDVIAKISRDNYLSLIETMGISIALNPLDISTADILRYIHGSKRILASQLIQGQAEIIEVIAAGHMKLLRKPLKELNLPEGIIIAAVHRGQEVIIPHGDTVIQAGDRVMLVCLLSEMPELEKLLDSSKKFGLF